MNETARGQEWAQYLQALPAAEPPAGLRYRVLQGWPERRRRRWRTVLALAAAATLGALAMRGLLAPGPTGLPEPADPLLASQRLEQRLLDGPAAADPALRAGVVEIDRALGAAYRRGAGGEELDALWRARARALEQGLDAVPPVPARI